MRVLYLTQYYPPTIGAGSVRSAAMVQTWAERDWTIDVVTEYPVYPLGTAMDLTKVQEVELETPKGVTVHRVKTAEYTPASFLQKLWNQLSFLIASVLFILRHPQSYDLVYVTSPPLFPAFGGLLLKKILGARLTVELRDLWPDAIQPHTPIGTNSWGYQLLKRMEEYLYDQADRLVTVTPESKQMIKPLSNGTPVSMIRNGVDDQTFTPTNGVPVEPSPTFTVGYVGSFASQHDLRTLLKAAELCSTDPEIEFQIIGSGKREAEFRRLLQAHPQAKVNWMGLQPHDKVPSLIRHFDVAVNPIIESAATRSSVTVKFYEYLACGVPVINSARGAAEELGEQSGAVISIDPNSPEALRDIILELKNNPSRLQQLQKAAIGYFKSEGSRFSRSFQANKLADILNTEIIR
ncbi:MAG: glycosyltransferase family 4 protein [Bacteroidota bacterium]